MSGKLGMKIASVVLGIVLWVFVLSRGYSDVTLGVPVQFINLPPGLQMVDHGIAVVSVSLKGHERFIKSMTSADLRVRLDMGGAVKGPNEINVDRKNVELPPFVRLGKIKPSSIVVGVEETLKKSVPVRAATIGLPQKGYRVAHVVVTPVKVRVEGGERALSHLKILKTEPVDITSASDTFTVQVGVEPPGGGLKPSIDTVTVKIIIKKEQE